MPRTRRVAVAAAATGGEEDTAAASVAVAAEANWCPNADEIDALGRREARCRVDAGTALLSAVLVAALPAAQATRTTRSSPPRAAIVLDLPNEVVTAFGSRFRSSGVRYR